MKKILFYLLSMTIIHFSTNAQNTVLDWVKQIEANNNMVASDIYIDKESNVYITGYFVNDTVDFDPGSGTANLFPAGNYNIYLAKYTSSGAYIWAKNIGGANNWCMGRRLTVDNSSNVYVTGRFSNTVDFDPGPGYAPLSAKGQNYDVFIAKYDSSGNYAWVKGIGGKYTNDDPEGITSDKWGNIYVTGTFADTVDFDPGPGVFNIVGNATYYPNERTPAPDIFILKLNNAGEFMWAKKMGGESMEQPSGGIAVDDSGNVYSSGYFWGSGDYDPGSGTFTMNVMGEVDMFLSKLDSTGNFVWAKQVGGTFNAMDMFAASYDLRIGKSGSIYLTGAFTGSIDFNPGLGIAVLSTTETSSFILKLDNAGNFSWVRNFSVGRNRGYRMVLDRQENIYVSGNFSDTVDFDPGNGVSNLVSTSSSSVFGSTYLAKFDASGRFQWAKSIDGTGTAEYGGALQISTDGALYAAGHFTGTLDFDPNAGIVNKTATNNTYDIFLLKLFCNDTSSSSITQKVCGEHFTFLDETFTASGGYTLHLPNAAGCDSTIRLNLTLSNPIAVITTDQFVLGTTDTFAIYQWLLDGKPIPRATRSTYTVTENGNYQVVVSDENGCVDTSDIYVVNNVGIDDSKKYGNTTNVYPNPANSVIIIESPVDVNVTLTGIDGRVLLIKEKAKDINVVGVGKGIYFLRITDREGRLIKTEKIVVQ